MKQRNEINKQSPMEVRISSHIHANIGKSSSLFLNKKGTQRFVHQRTMDDEDSGIFSKQVELLESLVDNGELETIDIMLKQTYVSAASSVLTSLCIQLEDADSRDFNRIAPAIALLLRHKVDALMPEELSDSSAADLIHSNPKLEAYLHEQGLCVGYTPRRLRRNPALLEDDIGHLPQSAHPPVKDLRRCFNDIAAMLSTPPIGSWGERARSLVPELMSQVDPKRAAEIVMLLPDWQEPGNDLRKLCHSVQRAKRLIFPPDWLFTTAESLYAFGNKFAAHELLTLMGRSPDAGSLIKQLCTDKRPAFAAGAWEAGLQQTGIALSERNCMWRLFEEDSELQQRAQCITNALYGLSSGIEYESGFIDFGKSHAVDELEQNDLNELCRTLRIYGQDATASYLVELHSLRCAKENASEQNIRLKELESPRHAEDASFAVEIALAKFIREHYTGF